MKKHFTYQSTDGQTKIHAIAWEPEGDPVAVLQICHGMVEFIDRYDPFASFLMQQGYYVVGNDHLGHGESVTSDEKHGYFAEPDGNACVIGDIHTLRKMTRDAFPDLPYFMLGHSMGSFLVRQYIESYGEGLAGVIIMGTGYQSGSTLSLGKMMCRTSAATHGWDYRSERINNMAFGSYNQQFEPARTSMDWLSKEEDVVDAYLNHPWCTFQFTVNGYYNLFSGMQAARDSQQIQQIPKDLPMLFVSGACDPVGENGKGVEKAYQLYERAGIKDLSMKLYENDRHEILNESDRDVVYADLLAWLEEHRKKAGALRK
ncbi:MAG: alpha/beta hydrolase [Lachnospiraceae bacterium]|nr:alpha/beta hydrolase [Lachnospiraceae bacterium]